MVEKRVTNRTGIGFRVKSNELPIEKRVTNRTGIGFRVESNKLPIEIRVKVKVTK